jgi:hypothetical protein
MKTVIQHQPLRTPQGWNGQEASLVMQIENLFNDVYRLISILQEKIKELESDSEGE